MTEFSLVRLVVLRICLAAGLCMLISCQAPTSTSSGAPSSGAALAERAESHAANGPVRDLSQDEAAGGHILRKHVGRTDEQLVERLEHERRITGASTYTDRSAAEHAVGAAIAASQERIQRWLNRPGGHPNLVLDYDSPTPIGRTINRGESQSHPCSHALVVLKFSPPNDYYVLTSYPECR
ncbi:MAG: RNase A-like domain-containing protein [Terriglobales bacterium]